MRPTKVRSEAPTVRKHIRDFFTKTIIVVSSYQDPLAPFCSLAPAICVLVVKPRLLHPSRFLPSYILLLPDTELHCKQFHHPLRREAGLICSLVSCTARLFQL